MKKQLLCTLFLLFIGLNSGFAKETSALFTRHRPSFVDETCTPPYNLTAFNSTTTTVNLSWNKGLPTDNAWEILLVPQLSQNLPQGIPSDNPLLENGTIIIPVTGGTAASIISNLSTASFYVCYIRTVCSPSNKSSWTAPLLFNTMVCDETEKCIYKFVLSNATNNNWNLGRMQVRQNGIVVATLGTGGVNNPNGLI